MAKKATIKRLPVVETLGTLWVWSGHTHVLFYLGCVNVICKTGTLRWMSLKSIQVHVDGMSFVLLVCTCIGSRLSGHVTGDIVSCDRAVMSCDSHPDIARVVEVSYSLYSYSNYYVTV